MKWNGIKFKNLSKINYLFLLTIVIFFSCKKGDDSIQKLPEGINGFWIIAETITGNCHGSTQTEQKIPELCHSLSFSPFGHPSGQAP